MNRCDSRPYSVSSLKALKKLSAAALSRVVDYGGFQCWGRFGAGDPSVSSVGRAGARVGLWPASQHRAVCLRRHPQGGAVEHHDAGRALLPIASVCERVDLAYRGCAM